MAAFFVGGYNFSGYSILKNAGDFHESPIQ